MQYFLQEVALNMTWAKVEQPNLYWMSSTVTALKYYYTPCLVTLGTASNVMSMVIFSRKCFKQFSCMPYLITVAAVDVTFLITVILTWFHIYGIDIYNKGGGCQAVTLVLSICNFLSVWCTVGAVIDRTISLHQSPAATTSSFSTASTSTTSSSIISCSRMKANILVIGCVAVSLVVYRNISLLYGAQQILPYYTLCMPIPSAIKTLRILGHLDAVWNLAIPYLLILTLNVRCCWKLHVIRKQRDTIISAVDLRRNGTTELVRTPEEEIYTSQMIIISSTFFVLLNLPGHILRLYSSMTEEKYATDWVNQTLLFLWQQCLFYLFVTRAASNLLCYLFNPLFREELKSLLSRLLVCSSLKHYRASLEYSIYSLPLYTNTHHHRRHSASTSSTTRV